MDYDRTDIFENPPPVIDAAAAPESHVLANEEFEDLSRGKKNEKNRDKMPLRQAITSVDNNDSGHLNSALALFEVITHIVFLIVMVYVAFAGVSNEAFYFKQTMTDALTNGDVINLSDVSQIDDIWTYLINTLVPSLYTDQYQIEFNDDLVLFENKLLGRPFIRMLKVNNESCTVVDSFKREIKECFGPYSSSANDETPITVNDKSIPYLSASEIGTMKEYGTMQDYGGGGFVIPLDINDANITLETIQELMDARFIDRGTRAVFVDIPLYNGNVNLFCFVRIIFELPATGGVISRPRLEAMNLLRYKSSSGTFIIAMEGIFAGIVLFLIAKAALTLVRQRFRFFLSFWNWMDLAIIATSVVVVVLAFVQQRTSTKRINKIIESGFTEAVLDDAVNAMGNFNNWFSVVLFLSWMKVFKYISVNRTMSQLSATLSRSAKDIGGFAVMFAVFFFAYAQFGYLVFGTQIQSYSTFITAMIALLRTILGDFDYLALQTANNVLGPIFFITYIFFVFFILLNMFLAIINDSYVEVKQELDKKNDEFSVMGWIKLKMIGTIRGKKGAPPPPNEANVTYEEYKNELMRIGYKEKDIMAAFTKHDIKLEDSVCEKGIDRVSEEVNETIQRRNEINDEYEKMNIMDRRVDALETALSDSSKRLDVVLRHIAAAERRRTYVAENNTRLGIQNLIKSAAEKKED